MIIDNNEKAKIDGKQNIKNIIYEKKIPSIENKYICSISDESNETKYIGSLNENYLRNGLGFMTYKNGDFYFGEWKNNKKEGNGVYFYLSGDIYCGRWKENSKNDFGIYFWKNENKFKECFIGKFANDRRQSGICVYRQKKLLNIDSAYIDADALSNYVYFGEYEDNKKSDNNSLVYNYDKDIVFSGNILNDIAQEGYQMFLGKENENINLYSIKKFEISQSNPSQVVIIEEKESIMEENSSEYIIDKSKKFYKIIKKKNYWDYCDDILQKLSQTNKSKFELETFQEYSSSLKNLIKEIINENTADELFTP